MIKENKHTYLNEDFLNNSYFRSLAENSNHYILIIDPDSYLIKYINKHFPSVNLSDVLNKSVFDTNGKCH